MSTGVFFHPRFASRSWPVIGPKFRDFPPLLEKLACQPGIQVITPEPVVPELLEAVHTAEHLAQVKDKSFFPGALLAVGGAVEAAERVVSGQLDNALVCSVAAGHHASPDRAWGGTYLSCVGPVLTHLRRQQPELKVAVVDTDAHHGDGTRAVLKNWDRVLHLCFCDVDCTDTEARAHCVDVPWSAGDEAYLELFQRHLPLLEVFGPDLIVHLLGHDNCQGDYAERDLTPALYPQLVSLLREAARRHCAGRLVVITMGGARRDQTVAILEQVIRVLAGLN